MHSRMPLARPSPGRVVVGREGIPTWLARCWGVWSGGPTRRSTGFFLACMKPKLTNDATLPEWEMLHSSCCARLWLAPSDFGAGFSAPSNSIPPSCMTMTDAAAADDALVASRPRSARQDRPRYHDRPRDRQDDHLGTISAKFQFCSSGRSTSLTSSSGLVSTRPPRDPSGVVDGATSTARLTQARQVQHSHHGNAAALFSCAIGCGPWPLALLLFPRASVSSRPVS